MHPKNLSNQYIEALPPGLFDKTPKAVWAAIAISLATAGGDYLSECQGRIIEEWQALYQNGIVKQKPPKTGDQQ